MQRAAARHRSRPSAPVFALSMVQFVDVLGVTSVVTAIPAMLDGVGADDSLAGLVATAYAMFFGGLLVLGSRLGQKYGRRRTLLTGLTTLVIASAIGALATAGWQLVVARSLQGVASALSVPAALGLMLASVPDEEVRGQALALWSAAGATAGALGFIVGGVLTDLLGWPAIFWINIPVSIVLALGVTSTVSAAPDRIPGLSLDVPGAAILTTSVMALVLGSAFLEHGSTRHIGFMTIAAGCAGILLLVQWLRHAREPIIPLAAVRLRRLSIGTIGSFVNTATTSSAGVLLTLYLQREQGLGPFMTGLLLLPISIAVIAGSALAAPAMRRFKRRFVIGCGLGLIAIGNLAAAMALGSNPALVVALLAIGLGLGLSSVACNDIGTDVPEEHTPTAIGLLNTSAQLGTALGVGALVLIASPSAYGQISGTAFALAMTAVLAGLTAFSLARWTPSPDQLVGANTG